MAHQLYLKENLIIISNKSMRGITQGEKVSRILIDDGSTVNIMPKGTMRRLGVGKTWFVSHTNHMQWKINGSTSFAIDNMC